MHSYHYVVDNGHDPEGRRTHASSARDCCIVGGRCSLLSCRIHCGILCRLRWLLSGIRWELGTIRWQRNLSCTTIGLWKFGWQNKRTDQLFMSLYHHPPLGQVSPLPVAININWSRGSPDFLRAFLIFSDISDIDWFAVVRPQRIGWFIFGPPSDVQKSIQGWISLSVNDLTGSNGGHRGTAS